LRAVRRWIEQSTYCVIQGAEGWYMKDCVESKARRKCERCKMLVRLDRQMDGTGVACGV
jgi:hypothetical protein